MMTTALTTGFFAGTRRYLTPRESVMRQLGVTLAALLVLAMLCVLESMFDATRAASSGTLVQLDLVSALPRWSSWVLGEGVWWFALICAAQLVTFQVLSTPQLHHASHDTVGLRNRFSVLMQGAAALTTASWLLAVVVMAWQWMSVSGSDRSLAGILVFTGAAAGLSFYLGVELRQYYGADVLAELTRGRALAHRESLTRAKDFPRAPRKRLRVRMLVSVGAGVISAFLIGIVAAAVTGAELTYPFWVRAALVSTSVVGVFFMQTWASRNASTTANRGMQMFLCFVLLAPVALLFGATAMVILTPFLLAANDIFWFYFTLAAAALLAAALVVITHFISHAHRFQARLLGWMPPGAILVIESERAKDRVTAIDQAIDSEKKRRATAAGPASLPTSAGRNRVVPVLGGVTAASAIIGVLATLAFEKRR